MRVSALLAGGGLAVVAGCSLSPSLPSAQAFDSCRAQCSVLTDIEIPSCLIRKSVRDQVAPLFESVDTLEEELNLREGACGCLTARLAQDGSLENVELIYASLVDEPETVVNAFESIQLSGPIPDEASCMVGITMPITFFE